MQIPARTRFRMCAMLAVLAALAAAGLSANRGRPTVRIDAGLFKMLDFGPGGSLKIPASLPDLVIKSAEPVPASPSTLRIEVANIGGTPSQTTTLAVFYARSGHVLKKSFQVPAVEPRQSRWILADVGSPLAHAERLTARVNDSGVSNESDPLNNTMTIK